ncbi:MAG: hypothetical protein WBN23_14280 [Woeseia sp.]
MKFALLSLLASCSGDRQSTSLLFAPDEARLDRAQQQRIVSEFAKGFPLSADGRSFTDSNCGDVDPEATPIDLNGDGVFEVFIQWGNSCTSGGAGRSLSLFVGDASGNYRQELGFPALGWSVLRTEQRKWPDLSFGGPGFCHPVWTRQQGQYEYKCNLPEEPGGCAHRGNVCDDT